MSSIYLLELSKNVWNLLLLSWRHLRWSHASSPCVSTSSWCFGKALHKFDIAKLQALLQVGVFPFCAFATTFWAWILATCTRDDGNCTQGPCDSAYAGAAEISFWTLSHILHVRTCAWLMTVTVLAKNSRLESCFNDSYAIKSIWLESILMFRLFDVSMNSSHRGSHWPSKTG